MPATSTMAPIRVGLIGFGLAGRVFHGPLLATNPQFRLDLISTSQPGRAAEALADHPGATIVSSAAELLDRADDLDLVVIASPVTAHHEQVLAALGAGLAVVVDKPFVPRAAQAEALIARAGESGAMLTVYQNRRWDGDFLTLAALVEQEAFGRVHRFESAFERWGRPVSGRWQDVTDPAEGGGILFDLGSHLVDQALVLFGPAEVEYAALAAVRAGAVNDDEAFLVLRHRSGVVSHLAMSRAAGQSGPRFRVLGDRAAYQCSGLDGQEASLREGRWPDDPDYGVTSEEQWGSLGIDGALTSVPTLRGSYPAFYAGVADSIRDGSPPPVDPRDSMAALRLIERAHELARGGGR